MVLQSDSQGPRDALCPSQFALFTRMRRICDDGDPGDSRHSFFEKL